MDLSLILPPLLAGLIVLATHVPLGRQVLARGIIFIDLAVAQLAGLGVIVAHVVIDQPSLLTVQGFALLMAILGGLLFRWIETRNPKLLEAGIGASFVIAASIALLLLASDPHGGERMQDLLAGQLLWVSYDDLLAPTVITLGILLGWQLLGIDKRPLFFYLTFALAITTSVQLVGVYLVFSSLILTALGAYHYRSMLAGFIVGIAGYITGLLISLATDLPTGPVVVCSLAAAAIAISLSRRLKPT